MKLEKAVKICDETPIKAGKQGDRGHMRDTWGQKYEKIGFSKGIKIPDKIVGSSDLGELEYPWSLPKILFP